MNQNIRHGPIFNHWRKFDTLKVWEIASMMLGYEPRLLSDVLVNSGDPLDHHGVPLDSSDEERMLTSAVSAGLLTACPASPMCPNGHTEIAVASLIPLLRNHDEYCTLANELDHQRQSDTAFMGGDCSTSDLESISYHLLATPDQLLEAFSVWGLQKPWFKTPRDHTWLLNARKVMGKGQRSHVSKPLYCPLEVMNGLVTAIRGRQRMSENKGWDILESKFPDVFAKYSIGDPRDSN
jgi:hypothetical protein